jgi:hypothetical protein
MTFGKQKLFTTSIAIHSSGVVRTLSRREHRDLLDGTGSENLTLDLCGRPSTIRVRSRDGVRRLVSIQDTRVLGALALSDRPLCPDELPTAVADPSKVVERLRRRLRDVWIETGGRGEAKTYGFAIPRGMSAVVLVNPALSIDINRLPWFGTTE